jgi:N-acetylglucosamine kinase-like BadF-type ATPase
VDAGGTTTRCLVSTLAGEVLARAGAGGGNQNSSGGNPADTLAAALSTIDGDVRAGVVGGVVAAAGAARAGRVKAQAAADEGWRRAGLTGPIEVVTDLEAAFAAGTPAPAGVLLIAGTGAVAARFAGGDREQAALVQRADGYGWLAGDEGSAVWLGREAVRAVFRALDGRGPKTTLAEELAPTTGPTSPATGQSSRELSGGTAEDRAQALIEATFAAPPSALGRFAPIVSAAAISGDAVAQAIVAEAVAHLLHTLQAVTGDRPVAGPVVLGGGLLLNPGPVADAVRAAVRERFGVEPTFATDGAAGAAALAIARHTGRPLPADVHQRLTVAPDSGTRK